MCILLLTWEPLASFRTIYRIYRSIESFHFFIHNIVTSHHVIHFCARRAIIADAKQYTTTIIIFSFSNNGWSLYCHRSFVYFFCVTSSFQGFRVSPLQNQWQCCWLQILNVFLVRSFVKLNFKDVSIRKADFPLFTIQKK